MYTFVPCDDHIVLSGLTRLYGDLKKCHERAAAAVREEARCHQELRDLTQHEPRRDREINIAKRRAAHTSAMFEARAAFKPVFAAVADMQPKLDAGEVKANFLLVRDDTNAERWLSELYDHNVLCAAKLLKESIDTLARYPWDRIGLLSSSQASMLDIAQSTQLWEERKTWERWLASIPRLLPDADKRYELNDMPELTDENRWRRWLLLQCLWDVKRESGALFNQVTSRVHKRYVDAVQTALKAKGWMCTFTSMFDKQWLTLKRPEDSVAVLDAKDRLPPA